MKVAIRVQMPVSFDELLTIIGFIRDNGNFLNPVEVRVSDGVLIFFCEVRM